MKEDTNSGSAPQMESHAMIINLLLLIIIIIFHCPSGSSYFNAMIMIITIMIIITFSISYLCKVVLCHLALNLPSAVCNKHSLVLISIMILILTRSILMRRL